MSDLEQLFPGLDITLVNKWFGQIRAWGLVASALGIALPNIPDTTLRLYVAGGIVIVGGVCSVWSWAEKKWQERKAAAIVVDSTVASVQAGQPVVVKVTEVTPPGMPNIGEAIPIPPAFQVEATTADLNQASLRGELP